MSLFLDTINKKNKSNIPPIWLMRQAGRYMSEYRKIRTNYSNFIELCFDTAKAIEITMQPINKFDFDAAIFFSDILILPKLLGHNVNFQKNEGPVLDKITITNQVDNLSNNSPFDKIDNILNILKGVKEKLPKNKALIGFVGAPWTVASYMFEGGKQKNDFLESKKILYSNKKLADKLINLLTYQTIDYIKKQIDCNIDAIQIFDSWAGSLPEDLYYEYVILPTKEIVNEVRKYNKNVKIITFPRGSGYMYDSYIKNINSDVISVDQYVPLEKIREWQDSGLIIQGNMDPYLLLQSPEVLKKRIDKILNHLDVNRMIFNLGHGIYKETPIENVEFVINYIRNR